MTQTDKQGGVLTAVEGGIGTIEFFHPSHNALPSDVLADLAQAIEAMGQNEAARVIVLKSGGDRTFCAGASFDELIAIEDFETGKRFFMGFARVINAMRKCPKFIIGRVQGKAVGGGVGVAAATDYCLATRYADVKLSELAIGIGPFVVGPAVERKIGTSAMTQLAVDATRWQRAHWAREKGLYAQVYDEADQLDSAVQALAEKLAASNPEAMRLLKRAFWEGTDHWDELLEERAARSGKLVLGQFTRQAIERFKQKAG
jgi:methylglutaconyl-CoA hydratase